MIARQRLAGLELREMTTAVLAAIVIAREQESVRDLPAETARHVDELGEPNDGGSGQRQTLRPNDAIGVRLDDLGFAVDHETERPPHRNHRQRLVGRVECQTANDHETSPFQCRYTNSRLICRGGSGNGWTGPRSSDA